MARGGAPQNAFTVDLEEWFHICGVASLGPEHWASLPSRADYTTRRLLDLLDTAGIRATFFIVGWVAKRQPALVDAIVRAGHEIGSHGDLHQRVYELGPERFRSDLRASVAALTSVGVDRVEMFRAPEWSINAASLWALDILADEHFTLDASMAPLRMVGHTNFPRYPHLRQTPAGVIREMPPLVADRFGQVMPMGWGWGLRMSSVSRVLGIVEAENQAGRSTVFTVHPWEIDDQPPRVRLPPRLRFAHYFRLAGFMQRLTDVLTSGLPFGPISGIAVPDEVS